MRGKTIGMTSLVIHNQGKKKGMKRGIKTGQGMKY